VYYQLFLNCELIVVFTNYFRTCVVVIVAALLCWLLAEKKNIGSFV
jgi:hypothetical protein